MSKRGFVSFDFPAHTRSPKRLPRTRIKRGRTRSKAPDQNQAGRNVEILALTALARF